MQAIVDLIVILSAVLVGQTMAARRLQEDSTLIAHPKWEDKISTDQLTQELEKLQWTYMESKVRTAEQVAALLYTSVSKYDTELVAGVTVADLIHQNNFQPIADCSKKAFKKRSDLFERTMRAARGSRKGLAYAVNVYAMSCFFLAADQCLSSLDQVIRGEVNDAVWMANLKQKIREAYDNGLQFEWVSKMTY